MHSFLLIAGEYSKAARLASEAVAAYTREWPDIGAELRSLLHPLPGFRGVLVTLAPTNDYTPALLDFATDDTYAALCFGKLTGCSAPAQRLVTAFRDRGVAGARALDGSFAGLVFNPKEQSFDAFTDLVGMRSLRWAASNGVVAVASHDLLLVAAGLVDGSMDSSSVASTVACDWSLGGHSLLRQVNVCGAHHVLSYRHGSLQQTSSVPLSVSDRVSARDVQGRRRIVASIANDMEEATAHFAASQRAIRFSLTAGEDSRALLALLVQARGAELTAQTIGAADSRDVVVARRLAELTGVRHSITPVRPPDPSSFSAMTRLMSLCMNGMTNAKRALAPLPRWDPEKLALAGGEGGEIYTGFYYGAARGLHRTHISSQQLAERLIERRFKRLAALPFIDSQLVARIRERLETSLERLASVSRQPFDLLDLFYLYERYALWGAYGTRITWSPRWTPYNNIAAIRQAYRLPAPIGAHCTVQALLVRRHLPWRASLMPVNGSELLPLGGPGRQRELLRQLLKRVATRLSRTPRATNGQQPFPSREKIFNHELREQIHDLLLSSASMGVELFGRTGMERVLAEHAERENQLQPLGFLITAEIFRQQAQRLHGGQRPT